MKKIQTNLVRSILKAYTLVESLVVLFVVSFLTILLSSSVHQIVDATKEQLFFLEFEHLYKSSQKLSVVSQQAVTLELTTHQISNGYETVLVPSSIELDKERRILFDRNGGNSSLEKIEFSVGNKTIRYQLYLGSGNYKKTEK
ncbi:competence protein [Streptococcus sp. zg-86]|uniref:Competence protein n=1 Tax=Streptococcus zhangguiae TaxID=2664091 RepID=A0A6I4RDF8_9STRE|nr:MULTISPECIES: competence type IV pilus minor pilin ComGD [unclassified Streptococcus]MTB63858.1 competence protein [Streptococcus sp. zg-86]MTB90168.1 competence protein [Streptococcus sp. zg-36]MWV55840.1 competence protein [Streptococcus sp. zg-70]QTH48690.1 type II secretion system protein [Streptococcus sp. zg-86]